ncbi:MAG: hypothetical protein HDQ94_02960 [Desulfovibrio sp.]|nr:hypothetical protein [Desulfovibrio sp.]
MRKEAANSPVRNSTGTNTMMNDENMTVTAERHEPREGHMYNGHIYTESPTHTFRRFALGAVLAILALTFAPSLVDQYSATVAQPVVRESAATPALPDAAAQEVATPAPAAFSDALAAAPAGAQCSVAAHSCSVPAGDGASAMSSSETSVAYGFSQSARNVSHSRM